MKTIVKVVVVQDTSDDDHDISAVYVYPYVMSDEDCIKAAKQVSAKELIPDGLVEDDDDMTEEEALEFIEEFASFSVHTAEVAELPNA